MRLFVAIPLPSSIEDYLSNFIRIFRKPGDGIKWVDPRNIHLTLRFLGETEERLLPAIRTHITEVASAHSAIDCCIGKVGAFPNLNRPRVIWVGLENNVEKLSGIASELELRMQMLGFTPETKPFKPHLTLGRVREDAPRVVLNVDAVSRIGMPDATQLDTIVLFQSTLTPQGPIYKELLTAALS